MATRTRPQSLQASRRHEDLEAQDAGDYRAFVQSVRGREHVAVVPPSWLTQRGALRARARPGWRWVPAGRATSTVSSYGTCFTTTAIFASFLSLLTHACERHISTEGSMLKSFMWYFLILEQPKFVDVRASIFPFWYLTQQSEKRQTWYNIFHDLSCFNVSIFYRIDHCHIKIPMASFIEFSMQQIWIKTHMHTTLVVVDFTTSCFAKINWMVN